MRTILVGVDGSSSATRAVTWAARECHRGSRLVLVHVVDPLVRVWPESSPLFAELRRIVDGHGRAQLAEAELAARSARPGLPVEQRLRHGRTVPVLVDEAVRADLLVVGACGQHAFPDLGLGATTAALIGRVRCPLVTVHGHVPDEGPVVLGVDDSPGSEAAIAFAFEAASRRHAPLTAVLSWTDLALTGLYQGTSHLIPDWAELSVAHRLRLAERLAGWQERYPDVEVTRSVVEERPAKALLRAAEHARLLVVGTRGHSALADVLAGSTSHAVVRHARCPAVVVHPDSDVHSGRYSRPALARADGPETS
ncbi:nucleotide-binding universal stress UspA family protein [Crossiella equi]|uniref:Nucleotide-binding universal stress UspA family protein n=1 Tax=Crossiella equi TaxID=130796 RepID=A0ABS5A806_9PSEU|nr:universal stress protein [Crossiella equi]MBP2471835.1 nucleotide-binding universal stress UspA family protein [Crossiella equi]